MSDYLTAEEAADLLGVSRQALSLWRKEGRGPSWHTAPATGLRGRPPIVYDKAEVEALAARLQVNRQEAAERAMARKPGFTREVRAKINEAKRLRKVALQAVRKAKAATLTAAIAGDPDCNARLRRGEF